MSPQVACLCNHPEQGRGGGAFGAVHNVLNPLSTMSLLRVAAAKPKQVLLSAISRRLASSHAVEHHDEHHDDHHYVDDTVYPKESTCLASKATI